MNAIQLESLVRRNAERCANAKRIQCKCHCGGTLHRKPHSEEWIKQAITDLTEKEEAQHELDLG
jgi:hypothetical protein